MPCSAAAQAPAVGWRLIGRTAFLEASAAVREELRQRGVVSPNGRGERLKEYRRRRCCCRRRIAVFA